MTKITTTTGATSATAETIAAAAGTAAEQQSIEWLLKCKIVAAWCQ